MKNIAQRLLACVLMSAVITGGTMAYVEAQPGSAYTVQLPGLTAFAKRVPDAVRFDCIVTRVSNHEIAEITGEEPPEGEDWSESVDVQAYDEKGNPVGFFYSGVEAPHYSIHEYDENGNRVHSVSYRGGEQLLEIFAVYDTDGREASRETWTNGELSSTIEFIYTAQPDGTILREATSYDETGEVEIVEEDWQTLDSRGRVVATEIYLNGSDELWMQAAYEYDSKNRMTRSVVTSSDGIPDENYFTYIDAPDGSYTCTAEFYDDGTLVSRAEQQYDARGICIHQVEYNAAGEMTYEMTAQTLDM